MRLKRKSVISLTHEEARKFFLSKESYFSVNLPPYFNLDAILKQAIDVLGTSEILNVKSKILKDAKGSGIKYNNYENVNYTFQLNKTKNTYRPVTLIHPYLYVDLVNFLTYEKNWNELTFRLRELRDISQPYIVCHSLPFVPENKLEDKKESSLKFWKDIEQESIKLSLEYKYLTKLDINNFYGSIYTHSIPWAFHGIEESKKDSNKQELLGSRLDKKFQNMNNRETVSIPQGNKVSDLISEVLLAYLDSLLIKKLESVNKYKILRYRDDYRIFTDSIEDANLIKKELITILQRHKLSLSEKKSSQSPEVVRDSIKEDKLYWIMYDPVIKITNDKIYKKHRNISLKTHPFLRNNNFKVKNKRIKWIMDNRIYQTTVQKHLLIIKNFSDLYPNSGQLIGAFNEFDNRIFDWKNKDFTNAGTDIGVLLAIVTDIVKKNPKSTESGVKTISLLLSKINYKTSFSDVFESWRDQREILSDFEYKFLLLDQAYSNLAKSNYNDYLKIWFQRLVVKNLSEDTDFIVKYSKNVKNKLAKLVYEVIINEVHTSLFCEDWLKDKKRINLSLLIDKEYISSLEDVISNSEMRYTDYN